MAEGGGDTASLRILIDTSAVEAAIKALQQLTEAAEEAQSVTTKAGGEGPAHKAAAEGASEASSAMDELGRSYARLAVFMTHHLQMLGNVSVQTRLLMYALRYAGPTIAAFAAPIIVGGAAFARAAGEAKDFALAIATSGNAAGVTTTQLTNMAQQVGAQVGNVHAAAEALAQIATGTQIGGTALARAAAVGATAQRELGLQVKEFVANLQALQRDPLDAYRKLATSQNFFRVETEQTIERQLKQKDIFGAAATSQKAYIDATQNAIDKMKELNGESVHLNDLWDKIVNHFRKSTNQFAGMTDEALIQYMKDLQLENARALGQAGPKPGFFLRHFGITQAPAEETQAGVAEASAELARRAREAASSKAGADQAKATANAAFWGNVITEQLSAQVVLNKANAEATAQRARASSSAATAEVEVQKALLQGKYDLRTITQEQYYTESKRLVQEDLRIRLKAIDSEIQGIHTRAAAERKEIDVAAVGPLSPGEQAKRKAVGIKESADAYALLQQRQELQREAEVKLITFDNEYSKSMRERNLAIEENRESLDDYLRMLADQPAPFATAREVSYMRDIRAIQEDFIKRNRELEEERRKGMDFEEWIQKTADIEQAQREAYAIRAEQEAQFIRDRAQWSVGAIRAIKEYQDVAANVAQMTQDTFTHAFSSMEDAIINFAKTGRFAFREFASSVLEDIARMELRIVLSKVLESIFGAIFPSWGVGGGGGAGVGAIRKAVGGPVMAGGSYVVGERGPELFVPGASGMIIPNGGGGLNYAPVYNIDARGTDAARVMAIMPGVIKQASDHAVNRLLTSFNRSGLRAPRTA